MAFGNGDQISEKKTPQLNMKPDHFWSDWDLNVILYVSWALMAFLLLWLGSNYFGYNKKIIQANRAQTYWAQKSDARQAKATKAVIVPKQQTAGSLTYQEGLMVKKLSDFFTTVTTYDSASDYQSSQEAAKKYVADESFFNDFYQSDDDANGNSFVANAGIKSETRSVNVYPLGGTHYLVVVNYIPYHNRSDLYQNKSLTAVTAVFDVNGNVNQLSRVHLIHEFSIDANNQKD